MTVIIQGASGTGKELIAQLIYQKSLRKDKPFVAIDCGAIPETLVESELLVMKEALLLELRIGGKVSLNRPIAGLCF